MEDVFRQAHEGWKDFEFLGARILTSTLTVQFKHRRTEKEYRARFTFVDEETANTPPIRISAIDGPDEKVGIELKSVLSPLLKTLSIRIKRSSPDAIKPSRDKASDLRAELLDLIKDARKIAQKKSREELNEILLSIEDVEKSLSQHRDTTWVHLTVGRLLEESEQNSEAERVFTKVLTTLETRLEKGNHETPAARARLMVLKARALVGLNKNDEAVAIGKEILDEFKKPTVICSLTQLCDDLLRRRLFEPANTIVAELQNRGTDCARLATLKKTMDDLQTDSTPTSNKGTEAWQGPIGITENTQARSGSSRGRFGGSNKTPPQFIGGPQEDRPLFFNSSYLSWALLFFCGFFALFLCKARNPGKLSAPSVGFIAAVGLAGLLRLLIPDSNTLSNWKALSQITYPELSAFLTGNDLHPIWGFQSLVAAINWLIGGSLTAHTIGLNIILGMAASIAAGAIARVLHKDPWAPFLYACFAATLPLSIHFSSTESEMVCFTLITLVAIWIALGRSHVRLRTLALSATLSLLCYIRPEGLVLWPAILLLTRLKPAAEADSSEFPPIPWHHVLWAATLLAFPALWTTRQIQLVGGGISLGAAQLATDSGATRVVMDMIARSLDSGWNHLLNPELTPVAFLALAALGLTAMLKQIPLAAAGLILAATSISSIHLMIDSNLTALDNARIQHGITPFLIVFGGAGTLALAKLIGTRLKSIQSCALIMGAFLVLSSLTAPDRSQSFAHPLNSEFHALMDANFREKRDWKKETILLIPEMSDDEDIAHYNLIPAFFIPTPMRNLRPTPPESIADLRGKLLYEDTEILVYMGLYAHHASGPKVNAREWLEKRLKLDEDLDEEGNRAHLNNLYEKTLPLEHGPDKKDSDLRDRVFRIALFQIVQAEPEGKAQLK